MDTYEKKYKEALLRARQFSEHPLQEDSSNIVEYIFPELKESEDEKIRKELISLVENWKIFNPDSPFDEHPVYTSDKDTVDKILAWLEKQGRRNNDEMLQAISIGLSDIKEDVGWSDFGGTPIEEIQEWFEKQGDNPIKWNKNTKDYKPQKNHSVLMKTTHGIAEGEWQGVHWLQYRWSGIIKDSDVIAWIELSDLEKQGRQKPTWSEEDEQHIDSLLKRLDGLCRNEFERTRFAISEDKDWLESLKGRIGG